MSNPLEDYLNQFRFQLKGMSPEQRGAEVEEARQHLLALIQQRMEAGESREAAVSASIQQFGSPSANGRELSSALRRTRSHRFERFLADTHFTLAALLAYSAIVNAWGYFTLSFRFLLQSAEVFNFFPFPTKLTFQDWGSGPFIWLGVCALSGGLAVLSLCYKSEMRTTFFFVFTILTTFRLTMDAVSPLYYFFTPNLQLVEYLLKTVALTLSSVSLYVSLRRDKSLVSTISPSRKA